MPAAHHEEVVQILEIVVIVRQKSPILADRLGQRKDLQGRGMAG
jgi:hypothetical protein